MSTPLTQKDFDEKVYKYKKGFEQMEKDGILSEADHTGKRMILDEK